jgi:hypothetical protein
MDDPAPDVPARTAKPHCGRCMSAAVTTKRDHKAVNEGATYRICTDCYFELRACGEQDSKEVWECPAAAEGKSDCLCSCAPKQAAVGRKKRKSSNTSLRVSGVTLQDCSRLALQS